MARLEILSEDFKNRFFNSVDALLNNRRKYKEPRISGDCQVRLVKNCPSQESTNPLCNNCPFCIRTFNQLRDDLGRRFGLRAIEESPLIVGQKALRLGLRDVRVVIAMMSSGGSKENAGMIVADVLTSDAERKLYG